MANKAIRYRLYPNADQRIMFAKTFGCCRKVYNLMLNDKIDGSDVRNKYLLASVLSMLNSLCGMSTTLFYVLHIIRII